MTQARLADEVGVSRAVVWRIEHGRVDRVAIHTVERVAAALGARVDVRLLWHGEGLDRLLDARHAGLVERVIALLGDLGWTCASEVSFNVRGERGSIDILAFHQPTGCLIVIEVKSVVPDLQAMLAGLDRKGRLGRDIARERGWNAETVTRLLVLPDDRTARRRLAVHTATIQSVLPGTTVDVRRWLRSPVGVMHGVMFLTDGPEASIRHRVATRGIASRRDPRLQTERPAPRS
jgi:transcriptional regulator with XRE-family HTH domain